MKLTTFFVEGGLFGESESLKKGESEIPTEIVHSNINGAGSNPSV